MSTNALEKALWLIGTNPAEAARFRDNPRGYADGFRLDEAEKAIMAAMNVGAMARRDANTLLLMAAFIAVRGPQAMADYMQSMNTPA